MHWGARRDIIWIIWNGRFTANMQLCNLTKFFIRNKARQGLHRGSYEQLSSVAEGMYSAKAIDKLSNKLGIEMPITNAVNDLIEKNRSVDEIIDNLLSRPIKKEK